MIEEVILHYDGLGSAEQGTTCSVVSDGVTRKQDFRCPTEILHAVSFFCFYSLGNLLVKRNDELPGSVRRLFVVWLDVGNSTGFGKDVHGVRTNKLYLVSLSSPFKTPRLVMHVTSDDGVVVHAFHDTQIGAVYVDGIVHHSFVETVL